MTLPPTKIYSTQLYDAAIDVRRAAGQAELSATMTALYAVVEANIAAAVAAEREANAKLCEAFADENPSDPELVFAGQTMSEAIRARSAV